jgi:predicted component of type VI protein secretion system
MTAEWLCIWIHFVWSDALCMGFCIFAWKNLGVLLAVRGATSRRQRKVMEHLRTLLRIAVMVCAYLFLSAAATLFTSNKLKEWSRTEDLYTTCTNSESASFINWKAYGLNEEDPKIVCSMGEWGSL